MCSKVSWRRRTLVHLILLIIFESVLVVHVNLRTRQTELSAILISIS